MSKLCLRHGKRWVKSRIGSSQQGHQLRHQMPVVPQPGHQLGPQRPVVPQLGHRLGPQRTVNKR